VKKGEGGALRGRVGEKKGEGGGEGGKREKKGGRGQRVRSQV